MNDGETETTPIRIKCFERPYEAEAIERSLVKVMGELRERYASRFINEANVQRYNHGGSWRHPAHEHDVSIRMHQIESVWTIPWQDLVDNDLGIILRSLAPLSEDMDRQFAQHVYGMVSETAAAVGNVVDNKVEGGIAASFLAMWRKLELGVDRDGNVALPQLHMGPSAWESTKAALDAQPPEFYAEVQRIIDEKSAIALERERERKAKFVQGGEA
jgi:hypothetical protein